MDPKYLSKTFSKLQYKLFCIEQKIMLFEETMQNEWTSYHEQMLPSEFANQYDSYKDFYMSELSSRAYKKLMSKKEFIESQIDFLREFYL